MLTTNVSDFSYIKLSQKLFVKFIQKVGNEIFLFCHTSFITEKW